MKTKVTTKIETAIEDWQFGWWNSEEEAFVPLVDTEEGKREAAAAINVPEKLIEALLISMEDLQDLIRSDLMDIWIRIDNIEQQIPAR